MMDEIHYNIVENLLSGARWSSPDFGSGKYLQQNQGIK
jgi:hypothetical protein